MMSFYHHSFRTQRPRFQVPARTMPLLGCISCAGMLDVDSPDFLHFFFYEDMKAIYACTAALKRNEMIQDGTSSISCCDSRRMRPEVNLHLQRASHTENQYLTPNLGTR